MKQEHERSKLQEKIAAELREKAARTGLTDAEAPDMVDDSVYQENTSGTNVAFWAWMAVLGVVILTIVLVVIVMH